MQRVSSNYTIILKLFIPTFWLVFFGLFTLASVIIENENNPFFNTTEFKLGVVAFYVLGALFLYFTFLKLKRVDFGENQFFISNYFKTYKYPYEDIEVMKENNYLILKTMNIILKNKGSFGRKITFIPQNEFLMDFMKTHSHLFQEIELK